MEAGIVPAAKEMIERDQEVEADAGSAATATDDSPARAEASARLVFGAMTILRTLSASSKNRRRVIDCDMMLTLLRLAKNPVAEEASEELPIRQQLQLQALYIIELLATQFDFKAPLVTLRRQPLALCVISRRRSLHCVGSPSHPVRSTCGYAMLHTVTHGYMLSQAVTGCHRLSQAVTSSCTLFHTGGARGRRQPLRSPLRLAGCDARRSARAR